MNKRLLTAPIVVLSLIAAACGSDDPGESGPATEPEAAGTDDTAAPAAAPDGDKPTIDIVVNP